MNFKWAAAFSQSGNEIVRLTKRIKTQPDILLTNNKKFDTWDPSITKLGIPMYVGDSEGINKIIALSELTTLHGYLKIIPAKVCESNIINGHPGDIVMYPELAGKDPQKKAIDLGLNSTGVVIHGVTSVVDNGPILAYKQHKIEDGCTTDMLIKQLKDLQLEMWVEVLEEIFE